MLPVPPAVLGISMIADNLPYLLDMHIGPSIIKHTHVRRCKRSSLLVKFNLLVKHKSIL